MAENKESQIEQVSEKKSTDSSSAPDTAGKSSWPEVVGLPADEAKAKIKAETPDGYKIQVVPTGSFVTMDYRTDRIRIHLDSSGNVAHPPTFG